MHGVYYCWVELKSAFSDKKEHGPSRKYWGAQKKRDNKVKIKLNVLRLIIVFISQFTEYP